MKIPEQTKSSIRNMIRLLQLCLDEEDMTITDYYSIKFSLEKIGDWILKRKERE